MINNFAQQNLLNAGVKYRGLFVLLYLRDNFWMKEIKKSDLRNRYPIIFQSYVDIKIGFEELKYAGLIDGFNMDRTVVNEYSFIPEILDNIFSSTIVTLPKAKKEVNVEEVCNDVADIIKYYNTFDRLPRPANSTANVRNSIKTKLKTLSVETIKDGIEFASTQDWLFNKSEAIWCNLFWVINNIEGFCDGGKYRNKKEFGSKPVNSTVIL